MKKLSIPAVAALMISIVIAIGSINFLSPCIHDDGSFGTCHWAGQALFGLGILLAVQSLCALLITDSGIRLGLFLSMFFCAALTFLFPGILIDLCHMTTMRCRALMQPAIRILSILIALSALAGFLLEHKRRKTL